MLGKVSLSFPSNTHWLLLMDYCTSPECQNDVSLVCQDGTLTWNSLLLMQWSTVIRSFMSKEHQGGQCLECDSGITVMLPDFKVKSVRKALAWSARGQVPVKAEEISDVTDFIKAMGGQAETGKMKVTAKRVLAADLSCPQCGSQFRSKQEVMFHKEFCQMSLEFSREEPSNKAKRIELVDEEHGNLEDFSNTGEEGEVTLELPCIPDEESNDNNDFPTILIKNNTSLNGISSSQQDNSLGLKGQPYANSNLYQDVTNHDASKFPCQLCTSNLSSLPSLIRHISLSHFKEKLLRTFASDDTKCGLCHRDFANDKRLKCISKQVLAFHVASSHKKLRDVVPENMREYVDSLMTDSILGA